MIQLLAALAGAAILAYALTQAALSLAYAADDALARRRMPAPDPLDIIPMSAARQLQSLNNSVALNERI